VAAWNWWQFQPESSSTPILGNHWARKKKLPTAPVREKVRGICSVHSISTLTVSPLATGDGRPTAITVRSCALPSSGETKRRAAAMSIGGAEAGSRRIAVTSIQPMSRASRLGGWRRRPDRYASRSHVESVFRHAL
jgi:hypothetical protein